MINGWCMPRRDRLDKKSKHSIDVIVSRVVSSGMESRLTDSLELALKLTER